MYILRMNYFFLVHMYIAMCSDDRSGHKGLSWYSVKAQGQLRRPLAGSSKNLDAHTIKASHRPLTNARRQSRARMSPRKIVQASR